MYIPLQVTPT